MVIKFLIPLFAWNLVYGLLVVFLSQFGYHLGNSFNFKTLFLTPLYNGHQFSFNLASWFLFPLFVIQLINIFIVKLINKKEKLYYVYFFISLLLGFLGVTLAINGYYKGFYLLLVKVLYFLVNTLFVNIYNLLTFKARFFLVFSFFSVFRNFIRTYLFFFVLTKTE